MTETQRYAAIAQMIERYTLDNSGTPEAARAALIREGIYTAKGNLKKKFDESIDLKEAAA